MAMRYLLAAIAAALVLAFSVAEARAYGEECDGHRDPPHCLVFQAGAGITAAGLTMWGGEMIQMGLIPLVAGKIGMQKVFLGSYIGAGQSGGHGASAGGRQCAPNDINCRVAAAR